VDENRRRFLRQSGIVLSIAAAGEVIMLSPAAAREAGVPFQVLSAQDVATLEAMAEALVPGAREAGIAQYIDKQLAAPPADSLLMLKYLGVAAPDHPAFYRGGLAAAARMAQTRLGKPWASLDPAQAGELLAAMASGDSGDWDGPPPPFFQFVIRSDACDVVYGTEAGFARILMPYMPHIEPPSPW